MFFLRNIGRNLWRNKTRSTLNICITVLLLCFLGVYLGNIEKNKLALQGLAAALPVTGTITNRNGTQEIGLEITTQKADALLATGVARPIYTARAAGNIRPINQVEAVKSCDTTVVGVNDLAAFASLTPDSVEMREGESLAFLAGDAPACLVAKNYAAQHGIALGDEIAFPLYVFQYGKRDASFAIREVGDAVLPVVGLVSDSGAEVEDVIVPVRWLRLFVEQHQIPFYYDSLRFTVKNPLELNAFKEKMQQLYFFQVLGSAPDQRKGDTLVTFLLLRSRRREIAIAGSLGQSKFAGAAELWGENSILVLAGSLLAARILLGAVGISLWDTATICLIFFGCSFLGTWTALFLLLRFEPLSLLTKAD